ncbi:flagellar basal body P-ring formation chaperone FlgA [Algihabitans albus]|uniref:flagellar basal body P-ring formation chaperone FlgA n=1 Tax=Algihabitans albus TaxID=2164067 RepID=UPI000E5D542B|nr:flagellar basal body P-ring formation chaperone FlgA [Algihabitans albus]
MTKKTSRTSRIAKAPRRFLRGSAAAASLIAGLFAAASALADDTALSSTALQTAAAPIALKPQVTVDSDLVHLGDLFHGEISKADVPIARAPAPGEQIELQAQWLWSVARAYGVAWHPRSTLETVTLTRDSYLLDAARLEDILLEGLARHGMDQASLAVQLDNPRFSQHLPTSVAGQLEMGQLNHDPRSGRFAADLRAPTEDGRMLRVAVSGRLLEIVEVPVLSRRVAPGEVIGARDVDWMSMQADRVAANVVTDPNDLIGTSPRRGLRPGQPVRISEVGEPVLVEKNQMVLLRVQTAAMQLTAQGRAMEDGARGETIRVINTKSSTIVTGTVTETGLVVVQPLNATIGQ